MLTGPLTMPAWKPAFASPKDIVEAMIVAALEDTSAVALVKAPAEPRPRICSAGVQVPAWPLHVSLHSNIIPSRAESATVSQRAGNSRYDSK